MRDIPPGVKDDPVLSALISACGRPTAEDLIEWTRRHPNRADDILEIADILLAQTASEPSSELAARNLETAERHLAGALTRARRASGPRPAVPGVPRAPSRGRDPDRG